MARSKSHHEDQDLSGTSLVPVDYEPVFCSECGASYIVAPDPQQEVLICPTCGPSLPIAATDHQLELAQRSKRRWLPQMSFAWLQLATICVTFAGFMAFLSVMLENGPYVKSASRGDGYAPAARGEAFPPGRSIDDVGGSPSPSKADVADAQPAAVSAKPVTTIESPSATPSQADATLQPPAIAGSYAPEPKEFIEPIDDGMVVDDIIRRFSELFGRPVRLQCQLVGFDDDAEGRVPDHFEINGETIVVDPNDESAFRRLDIVDTTGKAFHGVYLQYDGELQSEFDWMLPGDWVVLEATPGWRRDRDINRHVWGLVVTKVTPAQIANVESAPRLRLATEPPSTPLNSEIGLRPGRSSDSSAGN